MVGVEKGYDVALSTIFQLYHVWSVLLVEETREKPMTFR
jgi:hypothetical protein